MYCLIPFAAETPKSRLESELSLAGRQSFATAMLADVLDALDAAGQSATVVSTAAIDDERITNRATVEIDDRELTTAVNGRLGSSSPTLIVMADLPLIQPPDVQRLLDSEADIVLAPGLGGGTNAMVVREPGFRADYHGASYLDHREAAVDLNATVETIDSRRLATDIDEPADLAEVLIHGTGHAREWLVKAGFELDTAEGRVTVERGEPG